jgi:hypothetical protein
VVLGRAVNDPQDKDDAGRLRLGRHRERATGCEMALDVEVFWTAE